VNILDKEEFRIKLEEINHLVEKKDYKGAMSVVDSIDWRRVKNVRTLCVVGEIYAANKRYEDSREIFLLAYHRASIGKNILYRLIEVSLKMGDVEEAEEFYNEFLEIAPNDNTKYILQYKIYKEKGASLEEQIKILEEYKEREFTEKWTYELAKLYYKAGDKERCLSLCDEMVLWFSEGSYVMKALDLKMRMGVLTGEEKEKYEKQFVPKLLAPEDAELLKEKKSSEAMEESFSEGPAIESIRIRNEKELGDAETLQDKISKGFRDIFGSKKKDEEEESMQEEDSEEIHEEMIKKTISKEEFAEIPQLEKEGAAPAKAAELKMPELNIPESIKKPEIVMPSFIMGSMDEIAASVEEERKEKEEQQMNPEEEDFDFNLEDTILAAASAQGIDIPEKAEEEEPFVEEKKETEEIAELEEEPMTEEDLQRAEEEFLNGGSSEVEEEFDSELFEDTIPEEGQEEPSLEELHLSEEEELEQFIDSMKPVDDRDALDIVPRSQELDETEKKLFTYFAKIPGMKEQIVDALTDVQESAADSTSKKGNIIVMGGRETGKTRLIGSLIPAICRELNLEAAKVAYVFAEQINGKNISSMVEKLSGGFFVIENANQLTQETADQLEKAMDADTEGMIVILEDEKIGMRKLIARFPKLARKFTSVINIPVFTNDELVMFAKVYTKENGYRIDQMGLLALYNLIGINQKEDEPMCIGIVKEMLDNAMAKTRGKFKKSVSKKRIDRDGFIMLYEKDFN
jgi:tetratricopeptide (TPR) repeat protein